MRIRIDIDVADHELDVATELLTVLRYGVLIEIDHSENYTVTSISSSAEGVVACAVMSPDSVHPHRSCSLVRHDALASVNHDDMGPARGIFSSSVYCMVQVHH